MQLDPSQLNLLLSAMETSFDFFEMDRLLQERFGKPLGNFTSPLKRFSDQVVDIYGYFNRRNIVEHLVIALRDARPQNGIFVILSDQFGFTKLPPDQQLEVMVRKAQPYQNVQEFRTKLAALEDKVCRIMTPTGAGTGVLVGVRYVITNYHVIEKYIAPNGVLSGNITCEFDHKQSSGGFLTALRSVAVVSCLVASPYAAEDIDPTKVNSDLDKLDYAILELSEDIANKPIVAGGDNRGFVQLPPNPAKPSLHDPIIILQHPRMQPMKVDIGSIVLEGATRIRHNANTDGGSSGAPVFDTQHNLIAIHHAGHNWPTASHPFNQAIPIQLIAAHARAQNIRI